MNNFKFNKKYRMRCYNCGIKLIPSREAVKLAPVPDNAQTAEHIPAKTLFGGYSNDYKKNIITVNACRKCNNDYSRDDEEFRNAIGMMNDGDERQTTLSESAAKSLLRKKAIESGRFIYDNKLDEIGIIFQKTTFLNVHEKNFKALFLHQYGKLLPDSFEVGVDLVNLEGQEFENRRFVFDYLNRNFYWKQSGHHDIFQYIIQPFRQILSTSKRDIIPIKRDKYFLGVFLYHNKILAIVAATNVRKLTKIVRKKRRSIKSKPIFITNYKHKTAQYSGWRLVKLNLFKTMKRQIPKK
jgi:hypothetical protein